MTYGLIIRDGTNTPRTITALQIRDGTNTPRDISELWVRDSNNVPRMVFALVAPLTASASPETVYGVSPSGTATTGATTVTPTGGVAPYTYAWNLIDSDGVPIPTADSPTSDTTTFTQTGTAPGSSNYATWTCTVTDDNGTTADAACQSFWTNP